MSGDAHVRFCEGLGVKFPRSTHLSDNLADGRKIRLLNILEVFTKESLAMVVDTSINGTRISHVLDRLGWMKRLPEVITVDNGPEFTGKVLDSWAYRNGVKLEFSRPGKPVDNAFIESFNRTVRDECLNDNWFLSLEHARILIEKWRVDYNTNLPHSALGGLTPAEFATQFEANFQEQVLQ
ncbi:MAG: transposase family protein [Chlorobiaceae bacterium]|nr:transposase family protein [Chlorobiaceae bacterium]